MTEENKQKIAKTLEAEIAELEADLEALRKQELEDKQLAENEKNRIWAEKVSKARALQRKRLEGRAKAKKMRNMTPARLQKLRALGKL